MDSECACVCGVVRVAKYSVKRILNALVCGVVRVANYSVKWILNALVCAVVVKLWLACGAGE